jgi:flagellar assembly protein FliH
MSLSSGMQGKALTGRVLLGMDTPGPDEMTLQEMEGKRKLVWDEAMDLEFMDRVRQRAKTKAKEIIQQAMEEARRIRSSAHDTGMNEGLAAGEQELEQHLQSISEGLGYVIRTIQEQADVVWAARRADFLRLIRMAVEKTLGIEMAERRQEMLGTLLDEAVARIESERLFVIKTAPGDNEIIENLLARAQAAHPKLQKWSVKADPAITAGVVIETADARAQNTVDDRWAAVSALLDQLSMDPPTEQEQQAAAKGQGQG